VFLHAWCSGTQMPKENVHNVTRNAPLVHRLQFASHVMDSIYFSKVSVLILAPLDIMESQEPV